jgi:hypothetical protein
MKNRSFVLVILGSLALLAAFARADKTVVKLITDQTTIGPGALIVSSGIDATDSRYLFQCSRLDGEGSVNIEETLNGAAWTRVGTLRTKGEIVVAPACGNCAFRANVTVCRACIITVVGTMSGAPVLTVVTPTATPTP